MKTNIITICFLMTCSLVSLSQKIEFSEEPIYVLQNSNEGEIYKVEILKDIVPTYKYELIDNPAYISRVKEIDSLQKRVNELKDNNFGGSLKKALGFSKKSEKEKEIESLEKKIVELKRDIPQKGVYRTGYEYPIPEQIYGYTPIGEQSKDFLIVDLKNNISDQLESNVFLVEIANYGPNFYYALKKDTLAFKKNELITEDDIRSNFGSKGISELSIEVGYLYKRVNDSSIFAFSKKAKENLINQKEYDFLKLLSNLEINIEKSTERSGYTIEKNGKKCNLTPEIREYLETRKNADIINKINTSVTQYRNYLKQQSDITVKMTKYINKRQSYIKLSNAETADWTTLTKQALAIENKINKIPFIDSIPYQLESNENELHSANIDLILYSKQVLGL